MSEIYKPLSLNSIWATRGDRVKPSDDKIAEGWNPEIPPRQFFNWFWHKIDSAIAHFNQRGISQWDALTPYLKDRSYVQSADGRVYRAVLDSRGKDPMVDSTHWTVAFAANDDPISRRSFIGYIASSGDLTATVNYKYYFTNSAELTLPSIGERGDAVVVSKTPDVSVLVKVAGGENIFTHLGEFESVVFDIYDEVNFIHNGTHWEVV